MPAPFLRIGQIHPWSLSRQRHKAAGRPFEATPSTELTFQRVNSLRPATAVWVFRYRLARERRSLVSVCCSFYSFPPYHLSSPPPHLPPHPLPSLSRWPGDVILTFKVRRNFFTEKKTMFVCIIYNDNPAFKGDQKFSC